MKDAVRKQNDLAKRYGKQKKRAKKTYGDSFEESQRNIFECCLARTFIQNLHLFDEVHVLIQGVAFSRLQIVLTVRSEARS